MSTLFQCLLIYDIPDDRIRNRIADACQDYGLDRIQYSAFSGRLRPLHQRALMQRIQDILGEQPGKVWLIPLCARDWQQRQVIEQESEDA